MSELSRSMVIQAGPPGPVHSKRVARAVSLVILARLTVRWSGSQRTRKSTTAVWGESTQMNVEENCPPSFQSTTFRGDGSGGVPVLRLRASSVRAIGPSPPMGHVPHQYPAQDDKNRHPM